MKRYLLTRILGRKIYIKNSFFRERKNNMRNDDNYLGLGSCVCTNMERYYSLDERPHEIINNRRRQEKLKV
jgi:hypothetical protein